MVDSYTFFTLIVALMATNVYFPNYRHKRLSIFSFAAGWLTGELALHHIAWQIGITFLFVIFGEITGGLDGLCLVVCVLCWLALARFHLRGIDARAKMETALTHALGTSYMDEILPEYKSQCLDAGIDRAALLRPFKRDRMDVEVIKDLSFDHQGLKLDLYLPASRSSNAPVLMQIHGGAWTENKGSKNEQAIPLMLHMARCGWACIAVSYRLSPKATFPEHIIDCKAALAWIKQHITEYGGDPEFIVVTGGSAGGHLSSLLALSANDPEFQPGFEQVDTQVQGCVPFYGVYDFTDAKRLMLNPGLEQILENSVMKKSLEDHQEAYLSASPINRITDQAPAFLIIHGDKDSLVPVTMGRDFASALQATSNEPVAYAEIKGAQHAFDLFASPRSEHVKLGVERFLTCLYSRYLRQKNSA